MSNFVGFTPDLLDSFDGCGSHFQPQPLQETQRSSKFRLSMTVVPDIDLFLRTCIVVEFFKCFWWKEG